MSVWNLIKTSIEDERIKDLEFDIIKLTKKCDELTIENINLKLNASRYEWIRDCILHMEDNISQKDC